MVVNMKRAFVILITVALGIALVACNTSNPLVSPAPVILLSPEDYPSRSSTWNPPHPTGGQQEQPSVGGTNSQYPYPSDYPYPTNPGQTYPPTQPGYTYPPTQPGYTYQPPTQPTGPYVPPPTTRPPDPIPEPKTKAEMVNLYNNLTAKVKAELPAFTKVMDTVVEKIDGGPEGERLLGLSIGGLGVRKEIGKKLGEGKKTSTAKKGQSNNFLLRSLLTDADVIQANCDVSGNTYTLTLQVANSTNPEKNGTAPLSRFTHDYVSRTEAIYEIEHISIGPVKTSATISSLTMTTRNVLIVARLDALTGRPISIKHSFGFDVRITDIYGKLLGIEVDLPVVDGAGNTKVDFTNFQF